MLDFAFYGLIPFAFIFADPYENGVAGGLLLLSFYINGASFLAFSIMAEKRGLSTDIRGAKSLYFTTGLAEATETIAVFLAFCLFPALVLRDRNLLRARVLLHDGVAHHAGADPLYGRAAGIEKRPYPGDTGVLYALKNQA